MVATPLILGSPFFVQVMLGTGSPVNPQDKVTLVLGSTFTRVGHSGVAVLGVCEIGSNFVNTLLPHILHNDSCSNRCMLFH